MRNGTKNSMYNGINKHSFDWKISKNSLALNSHNLLEMQFNLSDAVLLGSGDSIDQIPEVVSTYQVQFNHVKLNRDAYLSCLRNQKCSGAVKEADSVILNFMLNKAYTDMVKNAKNQTQRQQANAKIDKLMSDSKDRQSLEWFRIVDAYYEKEAKVQSQLLLDQALEQSAQLLEMVKLRFEDQRMQNEKKAELLKQQQEQYEEL